jgi:hypothetical protein
VRWHRRVGWFGAGLGALIPVLGVATAITMGRFNLYQLHQAGAEPGVPQETISSS